MDSELFTNSENDLAIVQKKRKAVLFFAVISLACLIVLTRPVEFATQYSILLEILGIHLIIFGVGYRIWSTIYIGGKKCAEVVKEGPYSMSRNPLYFGSICCSIGVGLQTGMLVFGLLCGFFCWLIFHIVTAREERFLLKRFGGVYQEYLSSTPRMMPKVRMYRDSTEFVTFKPMHLKRALQDNAWFFLAVPATELVEMAHEADIIPSLLIAI